MKSVVGLVLGLVGSIANMCFSIIVFVFFLLTFFGRGLLVEFERNETLLAFSNKIIIVLCILMVWYLLFGILGVIFSSMMNKSQKVKKGGVGCLISGILTINLFMVIGGIMAIANSGSQSDNSEVVNY